MLKRAAGRIAETTRNVLALEQRRAVLVIVLPTRSCLRNSQATSPLPVSIATNSDGCTLIYGDKTHSSLRLSCPVRLKFFRSRTFQPPILKEKFQIVASYVFS